MPSSQISIKKLKAIVFTDMADFTTISSQDEDKAFNLIQSENYKGDSQIEKEVHSFYIYFRKIL